MLTSASNFSNNSWLTPKFGSLSSPTTGSTFALSASPSFSKTYEDAESRMQFNNLFRRSCMQRALSVLTTCLDDPRRGTRPPSCVIDFFKCSNCNGDTWSAWNSVRDRYLLSIMFSSLISCRWGWISQLIPSRREIQSHVGQTTITGANFHFIFRFASLLSFLSCYRWNFWGLLTSAVVMPENLLFH